MNRREYARLRTVVSGLVKHRPRFRGLRLKITPISKEALEQQAQWEEPDQVEQQIGWEWEEIVALYRRSEHSRVELAIWSGSELCGLAIGKVSNGKLIAKVNFLQGSTRSRHPLKGKVFPVVDTYLEYWARALGIEYIGLQNPYEGAKSYYAKFGYTDSDPFDPRNRSMIRTVEIDPEV